MNEMCGDNRFEVIGEARERLLCATNIEDRQDEMAVLDSFLFRMWQMGWLPDTTTNDKEGSDALTCRNISDNREYGDFHCSICDARQDYQEIWGCKIPEIRFVQTCSHCPACGAKVVE